MMFRNINSNVIYLGMVCVKRITFDDITAERNQGSWDPERMRHELLALRSEQAFPQNYFRQKRLKGAMDVFVEKWGGGSRSDW